MLIFAYIIFISALQLIHTPLLVIYIGFASYSYLHFLYSVLYIIHI